MLKHERRQVDRAVLARQSSYFSMVWLHAVAVPSLIRGTACSVTITAWMHYDMLNAIPERSLKR